MDNLKLEKNSNSQRDKEFLHNPSWVIIPMVEVHLCLNSIGIIFIYILINHTFGFAPCVLQKKWICGKDEKSRRKTGVLLCLELN